MDALRDIDKDAWKEMKFPGRLVQLIQEDLAKSDPNSGKVAESKGDVDMEEEIIGSTIVEK